MTKVDLKNVHFMIPVHNSNKPLLRFKARGHHHHQFTCLPFSLSCVPCFFTQTLKPVTAILRKQGVRLVIYIDDILVMAELQDKAMDQTLGVMYLHLLKNMELTVQPQKMVNVPTEEKDFWGMQVHL